MRGTIWHASGPAGADAWGERARRPNKGMKLTNLSEAPGGTEAPPRAFRRFAAVRTGSQLIPGVGQTRGEGERTQTSPWLWQKKMTRPS
jgi:hypothetical protein